MVTAAGLKSQTSRELAQLAKSEGVRGWHAMRKDELVKALLSAAKKAERDDNRKRATNQRASATSTGKNRLPSNDRSARTKAKQVSSASRSKSNRLNQSPVESEIAKTIRAERQRQENLKDLSITNALTDGQDLIEEDRLALIVRDAWWMQVYWEVTRASVQRARVAMGHNWRNARPALRLLEITSDGNTNSVETFVRDVVVAGGARNWFVEFPAHEDRPDSRKYRIAIGYLTTDDQFHMIAKSNEVIAPTNCATSVEDNWADISLDPECYYTLSGGQDENVLSGDLQDVFEEKTHQSMSLRMFEPRASMPGIFGSRLDFEVDAQMIVYGSATPTAAVTVAGEPVRLQQDGTFAMRMDLPDRRQVIPVVAATRDGTRQHTTIIAIERNTKVMEPMTHDPNMPQE